MSFSFFSARQADCLQDSPLIRPTDPSFTKHWPTYYILCIPRCISLFSRFHASPVMSSTSSEIGPKSRSTLKWFDFARSKNLSGVGEQVSGMCGTEDFLDMHSWCYRQARRSKMSDAHESTSGLRRGESFRRTAANRGHDGALAGAAGAESARPAAATLDKEGSKSMRHTTPNESAFVPFDHRPFCRCCPQPSQDGAGWLVGPEISIFARLSHCAWSICVGTVGS